MLYGLGMTDVSNDDRARVFAQNLKRSRVARGWTQTDLAREMKERGFAFHQQTIQRIEDQLRPVRLDEAYAFSEILEQTVDQMSWDQATLRNQELRDLMFGASRLTTATLQASDRWFQESSSFASHLAHLVSEDPDSERLPIGIALLAKVVEAIDRTNAGVDGSVGEPFLAASLNANGRKQAAESGSEIAEPERSIRDLVDQTTIDEKLMGLSPLELSNMYLASAADGLG